MIEEINEYKFQVDTNSFFQINHYICSKIFEILKENLEENMTCLDLYSGVGTLSIVASKKSRFVYSIEINEHSHKNALENKKLNNYLERLEKKDWNFFTTKKLEELNNLLNDAQGKAARDTYLSLIKIFQYRMNNRIEYSKDDYIHVALNELEIYLPDYFTLKNKGTLNKEEKEYYQEMKNTIATNEYIIKNKKDINDNNSLVNVLHNFPSDFGLFILIYIIMISGSIVSEEFSKGTIKYLLTKPYRRRTILASKLITILLLIPIIILLL